MVQDAPSSGDPGPQSLELSSYGMNSGPAGPSSGTAVQSDRSAVSGVGTADDNGVINTFLLNVPEFALTGHSEASNVADRPAAVSGTTSPTGSARQANEAVSSNARRPGQGLQFYIGRIFTRDGRELRTLIGMGLRSSFCVIQIGIITVILSLSATVMRSHGNPDLTEWQACNRPLGTWTSLWAARGVISTVMNVWEWQRYQEKRRRLASRRISDGETVRPLPVPDDDDDRSLQWADEVRTPPAQNIPPVTLASAGRGPPILVSETRAPPPELTEAPIPVPTIYPPAPTHTPGTLRPDLAAAERPRPRDASRVTLPSDLMYDRADTFLTSLAVIHFIGNHILLYTSVYECRVSSPHVWWLAFGVASLGYVIVLELVLIAFVVFVLGPLLLLIINILMLCIGRPTDRHGNTIVRAEIPRLDKKQIDKIPLVVFVPPIPEEQTDAAKNEQGEITQLGSGNVANQAGGANLSADAASTPQTTRVSTGFRWMSRKSKDATGRVVPWTSKNITDKEDPRFEKSKYPFVILEGSRATCSICLTDFVEPKRRDGTPAAPKIIPEVPAVIGSGANDVAPAENTANDDGDFSGGIPGEALRLLACGHVFHTHCLDPWLSGTSGRCPVCSRKVEFKGQTPDPP